MAAEGAIFSLTGRSYSLPGVTGFCVHEKWMDTDKLHPSTIDVLRAAGWSPERRVDVSHEKEMLEQGGFLVHPCVTSFLQNMRGISMFCREVDRYETLAEFSLLPWVQKSVPSEYHSAWLAATGEYLCFVGFSVANMANLYLDSFGRMYADIPPALFRLGDSPEEGLNALVLNRWGLMLISFD
jgi:hypothetical protein